MVEPVATVAGVAVIAAGALALSDGFTHWTVPAVGPWAVAAGAIDAANRAGVYDTLAAPTPPAVVVAVPTVLAVTTWVLAGSIAARRGMSARERYLAAAGTGVWLPLVTALLVDFGVPAGRVLWVLTVPLATVLVATLGFLAVGFLVADLITDLRAAGLYTVGTVVFEAAASTAARRFLDATGDGVVVAAVRAGIAAAGLDATWWAVLFVQLAVGLAVVFVCGRLARIRSAVGHAAVFVVSVVTLWSGTTVLLSAALG